MWFLLFLTLSVAAAQQTNSASSVTNSETIAELKAKAEKGDAAAQSSLGTMYLTGFHVPRNLVEAVKWFRKAANQGDIRAQGNLGTMYRMGQGVPQDYVEAVKWYRRSAEQGDQMDQLLLGDCYQRGEGVPKDYVEAYKWYNLAVSHGGVFGGIYREVFAKERLNGLEERLTSEQIAEAQRRAAAFVPRKRNARFEFGQFWFTCKPNIDRYGLFHYRRWLFDYQQSCCRTCRESAFAHRRRTH